jgi:hypothetical protein
MIIYVDVHCGFEPSTLVDGNPMQEQPQTADDRLESLEERIRELESTVEHTPQSGTTRRRTLAGLAGGLGLVAAASQPGGATQSPRNDAEGRSEPDSANGERARRPVGTERVTDLVQITPTFVSSYSDVGAAINDAISTHGGGPAYARIDVEGEYDVSTTIDPELGEYIALDLQGAKLTAVDGLDANVIGKQTATSAIRNWIVRGGVIDGNGGNQNTLGTAVRFNDDGENYDNENIRVVDVDTRNCRNSGITVSGRNALIAFCRTLGWSAHGQLVTGENSRIVGGVAGESVDRGIRDWHIPFTILEGRNQAIVGCHAYDLADKPSVRTFTPEASIDGIIANCTAKNVGGSAHEGGKLVQIGRECERILLHNLTATGVSGYTTKTGVSPFPRNVTISNVRADAQLRIDDLSDVVVRNCVVPSIYALATNTDVENVSITGCDAAIRVGQSGGTYAVENATVADNHVADGNIKTNGVLSSWSGLVVRDNVVQKSSTDGRGISVTLPDGGVCSGNTVRYPGGGSNAVRGIQVSLQGTGQVCNNTVYESPGPGVYVSGGARPAIADNTVIRANQQGGTSGQYGAALVLDGVSDGDVHDNRFVGSTHANDVYETSECAGCVFTGNDVRNNTLTTNSGDVYPGVNRGFSGLSSPPSAPWDGAVYLDDGSNTASGNPALRLYDGSWNDL